jgi:hypothetical protein
MITRQDEIHMIKLSIKRAKEELELLDPNDENNRFKIPNKKSEIRILEAKLEQLLETEQIKTQEQNINPFIKVLKKINKESK